MALTGNEIVFVTGIRNYGDPSGETFQTTTAAIGNLGGGGGVGHEIIVSSGTTNTVITGDGNSIVLWNSATAGDKFQTIPTSTGTGQQLIIKDWYGDSESYPIRVTSVSGLIDGDLAYVEVSTAKGWVILKDTSLGWAIIG